MALSLRVKTETEFLSGAYVYETGKAVCGLKGIYEYSAARFRPEKVS